jgi:hypothetical protein
MQTAAAEAIYRLRGPVTEFPNAWLRAKIGLRPFRVRNDIAGSGIDSACRLP